MSKLRKNREIKSVVAEPREGDGIDPREEKKKCLAHGSNDRRDFLALRLASQIRDILNLAILQYGDPLLASFVVGTVEPSAARGNFVVQLYSVNHSDDYDPSQVKAILNEIKPMLRAEVAKGVNRKKTPDFKFDVLPPLVQPR